MSVAQRGVLVGEEPRFCLEVTRLYKNKTEADNITGLTDTRDKGFGLSRRDPREVRRRISSRGTGGVLRG